MMKSENNEPNFSGAPAILAAVCLACLVPFVNKAFHLDDPLFIWAARHIQSHPFDFYGFQVNWSGQDMPMSQAMKNPPLASYYIALVASIFGWSEAVLHAAFLVPAIAAVLGIHRLAKEFCLRPMTAALAAMITPVFLLSATTVMCDIMMLAWWVWAVHLWLRGIKDDESTSLIAAALCIVMCSLTKYFGMSLIPLLFVYSYTRKRRLGQWTLCLLAPAVILAGYQWGTRALYGRGLLLDAASYATQTRDLVGPTLLTNAVIGLSFTGGCVATALFYAPLLWRKRGLAIGTFLTLAILGGSALATSVGRFQVHGLDGVKWLSVIQLALFVVAGINVLSLAVADLWNRRDADSLLLFLWILGTFVFASFLNWTVNARSILPMAPAAGILVLRRLEKRKEFDNPRTSWPVLAPLLPALLLGLSVVWADCRLADSARIAASAIAERYNPAGNIWFQGHWGFQYYLEKHGYRPFDFASTPLLPGELLVIPSNNSGIHFPAQGTASIVQEFQFTASQMLTTMNVELGAGFYSDLWGPLPFAFGRVPQERYYVLQLAGLR